MRGLALAGPTKRSPPGQPSRPRRVSLEQMLPSDRTSKHRPGGGRAGSPSAPGCAAWLLMLRSPEGPSLGVEGGCRLSLKDAS